MTAERIRCKDEMNMFHVMHLLRESTNGFVFQVKKERERDREKDTNERDSRVRLREKARQWREIIEENGEKCKQVS